MRIDKLVMHADDVQPGDGNEFYGTPIREASNLDVDVREERELQQRIRMNLGVVSVPAELLPGEVITGNVIRRETTAEVVGEEFYEESPEEGIADLRPVDYWENYYAGRCL